MKKGFRTPSVKKSISARTTGKATRAVKRAVNPTYGKKGMGMINNPKKAVYNKVYNKTTVSVKDVYNSPKTSSSSSSKSVEKTYPDDPYYSPKGYIIVEDKVVVNGKKWYTSKKLLLNRILYLIYGIFIIIIGLGSLPFGIILILGSILFFHQSHNFSKMRKELLSQNKIK